jgi:hypothetical protein
MFYFRVKEKEEDSSHSGTQRTSHGKWQIPNKGVAKVFADFLKSFKLQIKIMISYL